ncbi:MAG: agmatine deiminase family protein [Candidatus Omnitrophica bacterium]|nr:agmatine deiminase family protein [Candidatus Omnitrophota bacterium]
MVVLRQMPEGYRMPAEWEPHEATWLAWPGNRTAWPGPLLKAVESVYLQMILALLPSEKVHLLVKNKEQASAVLKTLRAKKSLSQRLVFHEQKTGDIWIRDYGPVFITKKREKAFVKWPFNAWGRKYKDLIRDNRVVDGLKALKDLRRFDPGLVLEGGSLDVNGQGVCLTTEQCLLNPNRNPGFSREKIGDFLRNYLGVRKIIWLKKGIEGDDTDGHVDEVSRFVGPSTVVTAMESDKKDANFRTLADNREVLKNEKDPAGKSFQIVEIPMPGPVNAGVGSKKSRLPASYANFYIANRVVLVPIHGHSNDPIALKTLQRLFSGRKVVGIDCTALVHGLGSIHCITQQEPRV